MESVTAQKLKHEQLSHHITASSQYAHDEQTEEESHDGAGGAVTTKQTVMIELSTANDQDDQYHDHSDDKPLETENKNDRQSVDCFDYLKSVATATLDVFKKGLSIADAVTDLILFSAAARRAADGEEGNTRMLMILLFLSIMAPYILSYSSGIAMFLYRRTFNELSPLSLKSLLLTLYIFPTGCLYFIAIDISDALLSLYKFTAHILAKSDEEVLKSESSFVGYFGMSRMVCFVIYEVNGMISDVECDGDILSVFRSGSRSENRRKSLNFGSRLFRKFPFKLCCYTVSSMERK